MTPVVDLNPALESLLLHHEIESFLVDEALALDGREFERWLTFFAEDIRYWIPLRKNVASRSGKADHGGEADAAWIDDDMATLRKRVAQIRTGLHWAEEPLSRVVHCVSNMRVCQEDDGTYSVNSNVIVHRNRLETETDLIVARRVDRIRRQDGDLRIFRRQLLLNHHTLAAKNLSFFI